jgi:hypothetical protein
VQCKYSRILIIVKTFKVEKKLDSDHQHFFSAIEPNKFSPTLVVVADNGSVEIEMQDWATSFGVKICS